MSKASEFRLFGISTLFYFSSQSDERYVAEETDFLFMETHTKSFNYSMLISYKIKIVSNLINLKFLIYYY